LHLC